MFFFIKKPKFNTYSLSNTILKNLKKKYPNLKKIHLKNYNTINLNPNLLPSNLIKLTLKNYTIKPNLIKHFTKNLPKLSYLNISKTIKFNNKKLSYIYNTNQLKILIINNYYKITAKNLSKTTQQITNLKKIKIKNTTIKNKNQNFKLTTHHITRHIISLKHLNLQNYKPLTSNILKILLSNLKKLKTLNITYYLIKYDSFINIKPYLKKIKLLKIYSSKIKHQQIKNLKSILLKYSIKIIKYIKNYNSTIISS